MRFLVIVGWLLAETALAQAGESQPSVELLADRAFEQGFQIRENGKESAPVQWNPTTTPAWEVTRHYSKGSFADAEHVHLRRDGLTLEDDYGTLIAHPEDGSADLILGVNASKEFGGVYRQQGDPWPHLYVTQRLSNPKAASEANSPSIAEMEDLDFSISVRLLYDHPNRKAGWNPSRHAAQFLLLFTVQNLNRQSPGYGDYYWFDIALYDDRKPLTSLRVMQDKGSAKKTATQKLIYDIGVQPFTNEIVASGRWITLRGDLLPRLIAGLQEAWKRGYLPDSQNLADYHLGSVILGWEVPGLNDDAVAVKDFRLSARLRATGDKLKEN